MIKAIRDLELSLKSLNGRLAFFSVTSNEARAIRRQARKWPHSAGRTAGLTLRGGNVFLHDMVEAEAIVRAAKDADLVKQGRCPCCGQVVEGNRCA